MEYTSFHLQHQFQKEFSEDQCMISATSQEHKHSTSQSWIPSDIYNCYSNGFLTNSREYDMIDSLRVSTRPQEFGFHNEQNLPQQPVTDLLLPKAVDESQDPQCSPSLSFLYNPSVTGAEYLPVENLFNAQSLPTPDMTPSSLVSCSLGLNFQMLPSNSSDKVSSMVSEVTMTKRPSNWSRPKKSEARAKKSRPSCPPLKVRKEKVGDRIQTLQRLVAPFGKTSTVCVLSEAIGYIHLLHEQIQTLSIPYMKSAQSKTPRMKADLRSRGLCLVPVSYASFIHHCS